MFLPAHVVWVQEVDWTRPTAFVLGNEREGVSDTAVALADATAIIPMAGERQQVVSAGRSSHSYRQGLPSALMG